MSGNGKRGTVLVIGGGISGITAAIEASEAGCEVVLVEKNPYLGGRVAQMNQYFPKLCPPTCGLEINFRRLRTSPRIRCLTLSQVASVTGEPGNYKATIQRTPRFVNEKCTACGECVEACSNQVLKVVGIKFIIHHQHINVVKPEDCTGCLSCVEACPEGAIRELS